jgi:hypothetical protein
VSPEERAEDYLAALREQGSHMGIASAKGPLECASCECPWPCQALRKTYPRVAG